MKIFGYILLLCLIAVVVSAMGGFVFFETPFWLLFGWIFFLARKLPQLAWDWSQIAVGLVACSLATFTAGLHWLCRSCIKQSDTNEVHFIGELTSNWPISKSLAIVAAICFLFTAGIAVVGATHQVIWLSQNRWTGAHPFGRTDSANRLRLTAISAHIYHDKFGRLPAGVKKSPEGQLLHGWLTNLLPFIELDNLYAKIDQNRPWNHPDNRAAMSTEIPDLQMPFLDHQADYQWPGYGRTDFVSNVHVIGPGPAFKLTEITDGTSRTLMAGEAGANQRPWGHPVNWRDPAIGINRSKNGFYSHWKSGANMAFCDGSVQFLTEETDSEVLQALSTPAAGDAIDGQW